MPKLDEEYISSHTIEQIYALVIDIEKYPEFLPWCEVARVIERSETEMIAELTIGFMGFSEVYQSKILLYPEHEGVAEIEVTAISGPFKYLRNIWRFESMEHGCHIKFLVDFEFKSFLLENLISTFFSMACHKMVRAFEERADVLYSK